MIAKSRTTKCYGGKSHGKHSYGQGGFGGQPTVSFHNISQEKWDAIFGKKEEKKEEKEVNG